MAETQTAHDPYRVLGVSQQASQDEIRRAYRDLAKKLHPDLNPDDKQAEDRFKRVQAAYDILGDDDKRKRFDRGEIDAEGNERAQGFYRDFAQGGGGRRYSYRAGGAGPEFGGFEDISDIFADLFGQAGRRGGRTGGAGFDQAFGMGGRGAGAQGMRGSDVRYDLAVDFLDALTGAKKRITMPDGRTLDLAIPEGLQDGQTLRLKGQGEPGIGQGPAGDAYVAVQVQPHPYFERSGNDIHLELPVRLDEAVLGGKITAPTIHGSVNVTVPEGASSGKTLRLRGKGAKDPKTGRYGDQYVRLRIELPQGDDELKAFARAWGAKHSYNPRRRMTEGT